MFDLHLHKVVTILSNIKFNKYHTAPHWETQLHKLIVPLIIKMIIYEVISGTYPVIRWHHTQQLGGFIWVWHFVVCGGGGGGLTFLMIYKEQRRFTVRLLTLTSFLTFRKMLSCTDRADIFVLLLASVRLSVADQQPQERCFVTMLVNSSSLNNM